MTRIIDGINAYLTVLLPLIYVMWDLALKNPSKEDIKYIYVYIYATYAIEHPQQTAPLVIVRANELSIR